MYGTTQALIVAAIALQASANPVGLFERQVSSTIAHITPTFSSLPVSVVTITTTAPISEATVPSFPFPGSNGTYYICSFPSTNTTTNPTEPVTSTATPTATVSVTSTGNVLAPRAVTSISVSASNSTSSVSPSATKPVIITSYSSAVPIATPTTFTVVGASTTAIIECIPVPTGAYPQPPSPGINSTVSPGPLSTVTASILTSTAPTLSSPSSTAI
ncbi:unnamed protein product [Rhizoctonia solani]|uniref:Uncharacterized protein n=1 Tax=Rhizoctonia solani TaxID=456999 RepID=A0A8H3CRX9_9AGAM|nr:unnamed protein product [Rhizoctonia solani]